MKNEKNNVIEKATIIFSQYGARSTSMDELALRCGMSKRTLYEIFETKELLVVAVAQSLVSKNIQFTRVCTSISPNAISEMHNFFNHLHNLLVTTTPVFLFEIKKYYPDVYRLFEDFKNNTLIPFINKNIVRGITEGVYRTDIDKKNAGILYCWQLKNAMEDMSFLKKNPQQLVCFADEFFIHGIVNSKGAKLLGATCNDNNQNNLS